MKKQFLLFSFLLAMAVDSYAKIVTFTSAAGIDSFSQKEYVFQDDSKVSELKWDCPIAPCIELGAETRLYNFEFDLLYSTVIPIKCGSLKDLDFSNTGVAQFSRHDLYIDKKYDFSILTGYTFDIKNICLFPFATFCYKNQKFSGRDGYYQYPETGDWTGNEPKTNLTGNVISYESEFFIFGFGIDITFKSEYFAFKIGGVLNPYIKGNALDSHYVRKKQFYDSFDGAMGFSINSEFSYKKIFFKTSYEYIPLLKGKTSDSVIGASEVDFSELKGFQGGSSYTAFSLIVGYRM